MASKLAVKDFLKQLGPFVLVQRPEDKSGTNKFGLPEGAERTTISKPEAVSAGVLSLLFQFDDLEVVTLPPLQGVDELTVGRQPDNELVLDHPSVSKKHAVLRWDAKATRCTIEDLGSTNGTFLNTDIRLKKELVLKDGDIVSFGEVQYWYLLTKTLHEKLTKTAVRRDFRV